MELIKRTNKIKAYPGRIVGAKRNARFEAKPHVEFYAFLAKDKHVNLNSTFIFSRTLEAIALNFHTRKVCRPRHVYVKFERTPSAWLVNVWR